MTAKLAVIFNRLTPIAKLISTRSEHSDTNRTVGNYARKFNVPPVLVLFKDLAATPIRIHYPEIIIFVPIFNENDAI